MANNDNVIRPTDPLAAAVEALGAIMSALNARRLVEDMKLGPMREKLLEQTRTDEQLLELAADGFEKGAMELARLGHPGATVFECGPADVHG